MDWPEWWEWELEFSPHLLKRMIDRRFTEADLRQMLEDASDFKPDVVEFRYVIMTRWQQDAWEVIVEPDESTQQLVVVTAYPVS